jgi:hypothetical protein
MLAMLDKVIVVVMIFKTTGLNIMVTKVSNQAILITKQLQGQQSSNSLKPKRGKFKSSSLIRSQKRRDGMSCTSSDGKRSWKRSKKRITRNHLLILKKPRCRRS